ALAPAAWAAPAPAAAPTATTATAAAPAPTAAKLTAAQSASSHPTTLGGYPWPVGSTGWRWPSDR
ncbi:hypothetical protein BIT18_3951, partial [Mycobacterium tuberculosis variant bovis]